MSVWKDEPKEVEIAKEENAANDSNSEKPDETKDEAKEEKPEEVTKEEVRTISDVWFCYNDIIFRIPQ